MLSRELLFLWQEQTSALEVLSDPQMQIEFNTSFFAPLNFFSTQSDHYGMVVCAWGQQQHRQFVGLCAYWKISGAALEIGAPRARSATAQ